MGVPPKIGFAWEEQGEEEPGFVVDDDDHPNLVDDAVEHLDLLMEDVGQYYLTKSRTFCFVLLMTNPKIN